MNLNFPEGWEQKQLNELIEFVTGGDWGKDPSHEDEAFEFAYCIRGSEIRNWETEKGKTALLRKVKRSSVSTRRLQEGDILVEISGGGPEQPVGRTVMIDNAVLRYEPDVPKICTNFLRLVRPKKEVDSSFLNLFLKLVYTSGEVVKFQGGSNNLRNLKFSDYSKITIPLPPLAEQQRIVGKIEELFSELEAGKAALERASQGLKLYRQAVLKWAFEGRLTNADVVDGELPDRWLEVELGTLMESVRNGYSKKPDETGSYKILRISSVRPNSLDITDTRWLKERLPEENEIQESDLLFTRYNGSREFVGVSAIVPKLDEPIFYPDKLIRCRPKLKDKMHSLFLQYATNYGKARSFVLSRIKTTAGQTGIAGSEIKQMPVLLPFLEEQHRIVQEIESRLSVCDKIEGTIAESMAQAEALRQSILKKAFEGKLVASSKAPTRKRRDPRKHPLERKALAVYLIWEGHQDRRFGKTRLQKELLFAEYAMQVEYETDFEQKPHGPWDYFIDDLIREAEQEGWFYTSKTPNGQVRFEPGPNMHSLLNEHMHYLQEHDTKLKSVLGFVDVVEDLPELELYATVYAVWNNHIIRGLEPTLDRVLAEVREWSDVKAQYSDAEIEEAMYTLEGNGMKPVGWGKEILKPELR